MVGLVLALLAFVVVALAIIAFAAFPHRGRPVPGVPRLSETVERVAARVPLVEPDPTYGVLSSPERDVRARERFERAEDRVLRALGRSAQAGRGGSARNGAHARR